MPWSMSSFFDYRKSDTKEKGYADEAYPFLNIRYGNDYSSASPSPARAATIWFAVSWSGLMARIFLA